MTFTEQIKRLREERQIPQRKMAAALDIDTATYCKYEKGERRPKRKQVVIIAELLQADEKELLSLWLADQVVAVVTDEKEVADQALKMAQQIMKISKSR
jgi:transcriptional regulator with XRE-family HTH domain